MSDGGRERASIGVKVWKSCQKWSVQRAAVRSIAWLRDFVDFISDYTSHARRHSCVPCARTWTSAGNSPNRIL